MKDLTTPMKIVLLDMREQELNGGIVRNIYPAGQMRMINAGLYRRGLISQNARLTARGFDLSADLAEQVKHDWTQVVS